MKKLTLVLSLIFLAASVSAWPKYKKERDKLRSGYFYVTQSESTSGGRPIVRCHTPGQDACKGQEPETPPSTITTSWHTFSTAMDAADQYMDAQFTLGNLFGTEVKTYAVQQPDGSMEAITLRITWSYDANAPYEFITEYEEL